MSSFPRPAAGYTPCRVRLVLSDGGAVEGAIHAAPGQSLTDYFAAGGDWINVTAVRLADGRQSEHTALHGASVLWAAAVQRSIVLSHAVTGTQPRTVEAGLGNGLALRGTLDLPAQQRLSDYLQESPPFIPLRRAWMAGDGKILGDVVVSRAALQRLGEVSGTEPAAPGPAPLREEPRAVFAPLAFPRDSGPVTVGDEARGALHWLAAVAQRAGRSVDVRGLRPDTPARAAWPEVARAAGLEEGELAERVAMHFGLPAAAPESARPEALALVPEKTARRYGILPLRVEGRHLVVATADPMDLHAESALRFATGLLPRFEIAPAGAIESALDLCYAAGGAAEALVSGIDAELADAVRVLEETRPETVHAQELESAPVVRLANLVLRDAVRQGASDVHLEPGRSTGVVRFRVDGVLRPYMQMPLGVLSRVVSRFKVLGQLDIADRLRPQDGRARVEIDGRSYDLRLSTVPTRAAEKAVIRVLNPGDARRLDDLALPAEELRRIRQLLLHRSAIILVTGPTGSGKTSTLYAALREIATGETNIMSVEDPVEYELAGVTQIQVEPRRNVTFASALRAILRQDPDVIFVGEIRDRETAQVAVQASMTGHLVLATVHTNDAASAVARLADLDVDRTSVATALRGVVAQRLIRRVCAQCAEPITGELTEDEERLAGRYGTAPAVRSTGCGRCGGTGFRGRLPVAEILTVSAEIEQRIAAGATQAELEAAARASGARSLTDSALALVRAGETTLQEVERVLGESAAGARS